MLSWNVHGLPFRTGTPQRLIHIAGKISAEQPDVILLQEVWLGRYRRILWRELRHAYDFVYEPRRLTRRPRGGLLVLVRRGSGWRAGTERTFTTFAASAPWYRLSEADGISGKGILTTELFNGQRSLLLTATHLQAQYASRAYRDERRAQLDQLARELGAGSDRPHLIAGDFNTAADEDLYASHLALLGDDLTTTERCSCACGTYFDDDGARSKWIDYLFGRNLPRNAEIVRIQNDAADVPYSDHDGLLVRWTFPPHPSV